MGNRPPVPGHDQIVLSTPPGRCLCNSAEHRRLGCLADVIVTFGQLGTAWAKDALWFFNWGKSFPLCTQCWDNIRHIAQDHRPGLVITDTRQPQAGDQAETASTETTTCP
jgi:hypothetical protein